MSKKKKYSFPFAGHIKDKNYNFFVYIFFEKTYLDEVKIKKILSMGDDASSWIDNCFKFSNYSDIGGTDFTKIENNIKEMNLICPIEIALGIESKKESEYSAWHRWSLMYLDKLINYLDLLYKSQNDYAVFTIIDLSFTSDYKKLIPKKYLDWYYKVRDKSKNKN